MCQHIYFRSMRVHGQGHTARDHAYNADTLLQHWKNYQTSSMQVHFAEGTASFQNEQLASSFQGNHSEFSKRAACRDIFLSRKTQRVFKTGSMLFHFSKGSTSTSFQNEQYAGSSYKRCKKRKKCVRGTRRKIGRGCTVIIYTMVPGTRYIIHSRV